MERWTRWVIRYRWPIAGRGWLAVLVGGVAGRRRSSRRCSRTRSRCRGRTPSGRARSSQEHYGDRSDGAFTVVFRVPDSRDPALRARLQRRLAQAPPRRSRPGRRGCSCAGGEHVLYGDIVSTLDLADAKGYTTTSCGRCHTAAACAVVRHRAGGDPARPRPDLQRGPEEGRVRSRCPIALLVLLVVFGLSLAVTIPLLFAACTITGRSGLVYLLAHDLTMATYVTNLVQLIGLGIAIDYSLLDRLPLPRGARARRLERTTRSCARWQTAGRAVVFSGATVAIGLALLLFMPLAVHALDGDRRLPDPARLDRSRRRRCSRRCSRSTAGAGIARGVPSMLARAARATATANGFWARLAARDHAAAGRSSSPRAARCSSPRRFPSSRSS